eukprot:TRINITY_DN6510_c0_g1_i1.p3 TRINITY_DN6510_c0_g1~~TRINITY_DN6510_c0_g1_i1.p3  ORF type:complete len:102 (-),score=17.57 TRINITY_DN6510_c0_g1_i1:265-570(-)
MQSCSFRHILVVRILIWSKVQRQLWRRRLRNLSNVLERGEFGHFGDGLEEAFEEVLFGGQEGGGRGGEVKDELVERSGADVLVQVDLVEDVEGDQTLVETE